LAFNGSGVFNRIYNWVADRNAGIKINSARMDQEMDGFAAGLSNCVTKDGQTTITAHIPFNGKKITGLGDAAADTDALNRQTGDGRYLRVSSGFATIAQYLSKAAPNLALDTNTAWGGAAFVTGPAISGTWAPDFATGINFDRTQSGNATLGAPSNAASGQSGIILLRQDATGGRTITFDAVFKFEDAVQPLYSTAANKANAVCYTVVSPTYILASLVKGL
jgi:hypothetical protein